ncbi:uncharacterized protein LOC132558350 [Ylistrum balloti]|uniref:uncharacterized protein LOC132558350 n=1 Tax=Ylistrum balloti TaxID=509963 RepID=UPI002905CF38|nr:uncharacterized protein LOC132558350 [Ylistrum balloti]
MIMDSNASCKVCGRLERVMKRCTRCRNVLYCSRSCQLRDWVTHKYSCIRQTEEERHRTSSIADGSSTTDTPKQYRHDGTIFTDESNTLPYSPPVNFQKALHKVNREEQTHTDASAYSSADGTSGSRMYLNNNVYMSDAPTPDLSQPHEQIVVKGNNDKRTIVIQNTWSGEDVVKVIASEMTIPLDKLKTIHKGKVMTSDNIRSVIRPKAVFQVIGERAENEDGLDKRDIDIMMSQLHVDRNEAIRALRNKGDVIDALLHIGSK